MNDDRRNKVVSMYNTGKTVNMNYKQQAPDYGDMIRQRAQPVICEPLVRDTLDCQLRLVGLRDGPPSSYMP